MCFTIVWAPAAETYAQSALPQHPKGAGVYPVDVREALLAGTFTPRQSTGSSVELTARDRARVEQVPRLALITMDAMIGKSTTSEPSVRHRHIG